MRGRTMLLLALCACGSGPRPQLYPAGSDKDDGYGDLAQQSAHLTTGEGSDAHLFAPRRRRRDGEPYGGNPYGGATYGDPYGGASDPSPLVPSARGAGARASRYSATSGLTGAIDGSVTWRGAAPAPVVTACGAIEHPSVRIGDGGGVSGVLVFIEHVELGRTMPSYGRPASVGGTIAKRGCALAPAVQIVTPLPAGLAIYGDATAVKLRVTQPGGARPFELQEGGRLVVQAQPGVTRIEADDGSLGAAWVVASDTPYYAITDDRGRFRIDELAIGTYDVTFWRPPLPTATDGRLVYGAPVITHRTVTVGGPRPSRLDVTLER
ncbi:MAG TPA: carboxypeptidase-like regulatory domain-containing protein [Kofleriaceae bacterium]|nr:carboxypeptidase-like regulatory domain-containing protein [Kofleriaceae bacterium]